MKNKSENKFLDNLLEMIPIISMDYEKFSENKSFFVFLNNLEELENSKILYKMKNFPLKSNEEFFLSLKCILNNKKIYNPARTISCNHIECLEVKILFNYVIKFGHCPLCGSENHLKIGVESIYIDEFLKSLYSRYNSEKNILYPEYIIINKHTKIWRPFNPFQTNEEIEFLYHNEDDKYLILKRDDHFAELEDINSFIGRKENSINVSKLIDNLKKYR